MLFGLPFSLPKVVSIIGGGGKTTLLYLLGRRLSESGASVLLTTTTHLGLPQPEGIPLLSPETPSALLAAAGKGKALLAAYPLENGKLCGIPPEWLPACADVFDHILIEADGSRNLPLKWHHAHEPCVPPETELLIQLSGLTALGKNAGDVLHRQPSSFFAASHRIGEEDIAALQKRAFAHAGYAGRTVSILNQADTPEMKKRGARIRALLEAEGYPAFVGALGVTGLDLIGKDVFAC